MDLMMEQMGSSINSPPASVVTKTSDAGEVDFHGGSSRLASYSTASVVVSSKSTGSDAEGLMSRRHLSTRGVYCRNSHHHNVKQILQHNINHSNFTTSTNISRKRRKCHPISRKSTKSHWPPGTTINLAVKSPKLNSPIISQLLSINLFTFALLIVFIYQAIYQDLLIPVTPSSLFVEASRGAIDLHRLSRADLDESASSIYGLRRLAPNYVGVSSLGDSRSRFRYELATASTTGSSVLQRTTGSRAHQPEAINGRSLSQIQNQNNNNTSDGNRLASIQSQLSELRRQLELELSLDRRQVTLGSPCTSARDCSQSIERSHCKLDNFTCSCLPHHVQYNSTTCLPPSLLGYECLVDAQCQLKVPGSYCSPTGLCACLSKFVTHRKDKCLPASKINDYCLSDSQCQLADRHSHCKWKIYNVYGLCKCPPNYKHITVEASGGNSTSHQHQQIRCAPRLGDSCFDHGECLLATPDSICREPKISDRLQTNWRSSEASSRKCYCADGFSESPNKLECLPSPISIAIATTSVATGVSFSDLTTTGSDAATTPAMSMGSLSLSAPNSMNAKHHYDFVIPPAAAGNHKTQMDHNMQDSQEFDLRPLDQMAPAASSLSAATSSTDGTLKIPIDTLKSTTTTTTTTTTQRPKQQVAAPAGSSRPAKVKISSLGKSCSTRWDCQARDKHSDCINGICECIRPTAKCSANSTGCHRDTFQCRNGQCISWYFVCDQFKNCDDGSDEDECQAYHCPPEAFQCADGSCLARGKLCNGKTDCLDGSDERFCSSSSAVSKVQQDSSTGNSPLSTSSSTSSCHPRAFACDNGQCLPAYVFCNAVVDCSDGSDENERLCERVWPKRKWQPIGFSSSNNWTSTLLVTQENNTAAAAAADRLRLVMQQQQQQPLDSPVVKSDRLAMEKLLAASLVSGRTPDGRGRRLPAASSRRRQQEGSSSSSDAASGLRRQKRAAAIDHRGGSSNSSRSQCPRSAFTCRNGKCRSTAILCSGVDGCGDNSDEDRCEVCQCAAP